MLSSVLQECPTCCGVIAREYYATVDVRGKDGKFGHIDRFLWCEFCGMGIETSSYPDGYVFPLQYFVRTEPVSTGKFLQRLKDARVA